MSKKKARKKAKRQLKAMKRAGDIGGIVKVMGFAAVAFFAGAAGAASRTKLTEGGRFVVERLQRWGQRHGIGHADSGQKLERALNGLEAGS